MLVKELQSEFLARGFSDSGTAPEIRSRIGLELVASGVVAAVTAEANVVTTDTDEMRTAI